MKRKKLVVISHTEHYLDADGVIKGWGSTVNELNFLSDFWEEVHHVACLHDSPVPPSSLPYTAANIKFVPIPPYGGKSLMDKVFIFFKIPKIIFQTIKTIRGASEVQLRLPTGMGLFLLPLFSFFVPRSFTFWVKYAGNWKQQQPPLSYCLQRWWLRHNWAGCMVTINGFWPDQPSHCHSFENPCLTDLDIQRGKSISLSKSFEGPFVFSFVGRLENEKGVQRIIDALRSIPQEKIAGLHFIGNGPLEKEYKKSVGFLGEKVVFHGFLGHQGVHEVLSKTHFFLLPSTASEGFPKVIAEAGCYGAIPVVSNVSSIPHYIDASNGILWDIEKEILFGTVLKEAVALDEDVLGAKSQEVLKLAEKFTFANYKNKLMQILKF